MTAQLSANDALNETSPLTIQSLAIRRNTTTGHLAVILANNDEVEHSLAYPAPYEPHFTYHGNCITETCGQVAQVDVHPVSQAVYFAGDAHDVSVGGVIGQFMDDGTVSTYMPTNVSTHEPLLYACWALAFSMDGSYLYYGSLYSSEKDVVVQLNASDGSFVRRLLTDETDDTDGTPLALTTDQHDWVYVLRAGVAPQLSDGSISVYPPTAEKRTRKVPFTLSIGSVGSDVAGGLAWHDDVLYVADSEWVHAINGTLLRMEGLVKSVFVFKPV